MDFTLTSNKLTCQKIERTRKFDKAKTNFIPQLVALICLAFSGSAQADELILSWGKGPQPGSDQTNTQIAFDYNFYQLKRSERSGFSVGLGYTKLSSNTDQNKTLEAFTIYPQLTLRPVRESLRPYYFFVRALGPSYITNNTLGDRKQDNHFAFQAQVGVGYEHKINDDSTMLMQLSWKHFSNAGLFDDNDGIDIPIVFSFGIRY